MNLSPLLLTVCLSLACLQASAAANKATASVKEAAEAQQRIELMQNFEYSDEKQCYAVIVPGEEANPILNLLVASYGLPDFDKAALQSALEAAVARGCDVNELGHSGLSPLHEAVLFNEPELVRFLLAHDADIEQKIQRPDSAVHELNARQFLDKLLLLAAEGKGDMRDRSAVQAALAQAEKTRQNQEK